MNFVLTKHWFDQIASGLKTKEYRENSPYWKKRIASLESGDLITFSKGYTSIKIMKVITDIQYISWHRLESINPEVAEYFKDSKVGSFWEISFRDNGQDGKVRYFGEWYGNDVEWFPYYHYRTEDDPSFWPEEGWRIRAEVDHRPNGGFAMEWAIAEGIIRKVVG